MVASYEPASISSETENVEEQGLGPSVPCRAALVNAWETPFTVDYHQAKTALNP